jgi:hypothetical protein
MGWYWYTEAEGKVSKVGMVTEADDDDEPGCSAGGRPPVSPFPSRQLFLGRSCHDLSFLYVILWEADVFFK